MTEKISVIISVYNTKKYLKKCLESIIKDDYKELEILVIDDHSEESSFDLIEKINDKRIKYIYKEKNVGLSIIKQYGLDIAKGKYVIFIDSDDYIEKNSIKRMYDNIKKYKADISICDMVYVYPNKMYKFTKNKVVKLFNRKEAMKALYLDRGITFSLSNKLFKKELFKGLYINDINRDTKYQEYKEQVKIDVEAVRDKVDVLMVAMHWGVEYTHTPTDYQIDSAEFLAENDVDIVIGTHPHVIQPVTWIDDTLVFYSLGNFVSAQLQNQNYNKMVGLMSSLTITKTVKGDKVDITIGNVENELIFTSYNASTWRNFKVVPFSNENIGKYLSNYKSVYETYKAVVQKMDESMVVVPVFE